MVFLLMEKIPTTRSYMTDGQGGITYTRPPAAIRPIATYTFLTIAEIGRAALEDQYPDRTYEITSDILVEPTRAELLRSQQSVAR